MPGHVPGIPNGKEPAMTKLPAMKKLSETKNATRWEAKFPSTITKEGGTYYVTTYPDSDVIFIQTAVHGRKVNGERIKAAIREALKT